MVTVSFENRTVMVILIPMRVSERLDQKNDDMVINNSPIRLIEGGGLGQLDLL